MIKQYGAIPYLEKKGEVRVVLVTSASGYWIFPKGNLEEHLGKRGTAELEAFEEAGVSGSVVPGHVYRTTVMIREEREARLALYPLAVERVQEEWPEAYRRERRVVNISTARKLISSRPLLKCLARFERDFLL